MPHKFPFAAALLGSCLLASAQDGDGRFSGHLSPLLLSQQTRSQLDAEGQARIDALGPATASHRRGLLAPLFELNKPIGAGGGALFARCAIGGLADGYQLQAGYRWPLAQGSRLSLALLPGLVQQQVWQDPYALGTARRETEASVRGLQLQLDRVLGSSFDLQLAAGRRRIASEHSGQQGFSAAQQQSLRREGRLFYAALGQRLDLGGARSLQWQLDLREDRAEGAAMAARRWGGDWEIGQQLGRHGLALGAAWHRLGYEASHPLSGSRRRDHQQALSLRYHYGAPFGWRDTALIARLGWQRQSSNIAFYREREASLGLGLRYAF